MRLVKSNSVQAQALLTTNIAAVDLVAVGTDVFGQTLQKIVSKESRIANGHSIQTRYIGGR